MTLSIEVMQIPQLMVMMTLHPVGWTVAIGGIHACASEVLHETRIAECSRDMCRYMLQYSREYRQVAEVRRCGYLQRSPVMKQEDPHR